MPTPDRDGPRAVGTSIGKFAVVKLLGQGGMGAVYEAIDPDLGRSVAIKIIHEPDATRSMRLLREAQALGQLQHPNVVAVHEVGVDGDRVYVAMEKVDGETLAERPHPSPWRDVVALFVQAGRGIAAAHAKGLVHRDVKPSNILIDGHGRVRVGDFGLARRGSNDNSDGDNPGSGQARLGVGTAITVADSGDGTDGGGEDVVAPPSDRRELLGADLTGEGAYIGTPRYMSPEQRACKPATEQSDQFSFCVAMWEMLSGEHPFEVDGDGTFSTRGRLPPRGVPAWLTAALDRGLAEDPRKRHPSMTALCDVLERTPGRRRRRRLALGVGALVIAIVLVGWRLSRNPAAAVRCAEAGDGFAAVWNADGRAAIESAFAAVTPFGAETGARVVAALDDYQRRWSDVRIAACRATHERGVQSATVLDRRIRCLDQELGSATLVIQRLREGGADVVTRALGAVAGLPDPSACNAARFATALPLPDDPRVDQVHHEMAQARAANLGGDLAAARAHYVAARALADAIGHPGLRAEAARAYGQAVAESDPAASRAAFEQALAEAVRAGDRDLEAWIEILLLWQSTGRIDVKAIEALLPIARAAVARDGVSEKLRLEFNEAEAEALLRLGRFDESLAVCDRMGASEPAPAPRAGQCRCMARVEAGHVDAVAVCRASLAAFEQAYGASHPMVAAAASRLAKALGGDGEHVEALALHQRVQPIVEVAYGKESHDAAHGLCSIGITLSRLGQNAEARVQVETCIAMMERNGDVDPFVAAAHLVLADILVELGDADAGFEHLKRGREINEKILGPDHPDMVMTYAMQANAYSGAERWAESASLAATCVAKARHIDASHPLLGPCLTLQAQALLQTGPSADAVPVARDALRAMEASGADPTNIGVAHAVYAQSLLAAGDRVAARREVDSAIAILKTRGPGAADYLKEAVDLKRKL